MIVIRFGFEVLVGKWLTVKYFKIQQLNIAWRMVEGVFPISAIVALLAGYLHSPYASLLLLFAL